MKPNEIKPNKINNNNDLNGLRRLEIKGTFGFIKIYCRSEMAALREVNSLWAACRNDQKLKPV
jgi:hypothetical protein